MRYHPFLFERMIQRADPAARPGDIVAIYDRAGQFVGRGFFNPKSQIALRVLSFENVPIDDAFWSARLDRAVGLRTTLRLADSSDACRLVHSEGDDLSGLVVERYNDCLVFELFSRGFYERRAEIARAVIAAIQAQSAFSAAQAEDWRVYYRADEHVERLEGFHVTPEDNPAAPGRLIIREHGVRYRVDVARGHKTGFFCDQRDNRRAFAQYCQGKDVLDLCCYTGGFGLCAKQLGDAAQVTSVDLDEAALAIAKENANLNQLRIQHVHADVFIYLRQLLANKRRYDAVVLDPPKFARSRAEVEEALRKYNDCNMLAMQVVKPGGLLLTCSCSGLVSPEAFQRVITAAARRANRSVQILSTTGAAPDHPVALHCPESAYLKAFWLRIN